MGQTIAIISALHEEQAGLLALMPGQRPERLGGREVVSERLLDDDAGVGGQARLRQAVEAMTIVGERY